MPMTVRPTCDSLMRSIYRQGLSVSGTCRWDSILNKIIVGEPDSPDAPSVTSRCQGPEGSHRETLECVSEDG